VIALKQGTMGLAGAYHVSHPLNRWDAIGRAWTARPNRST